MVNRYTTRVAHLTNAIKVINDLIDGIPSKCTTTEHVELVAIFHDANKKLVARLAEEV